MARRKLSIDDKIEQQKLAVSKAKDRYEAVSYTHLDVYKRQI